MTEIRLVAMRFVPSDNGGYWTPAAEGSDTAGFQDLAWADAWRDAITMDEMLSVVVQPSNPEAVAKLRAAFNPEGERLSNRICEHFDLRASCPDCNPEGESEPCADCGGRGWLDAGTHRCPTCNPEGESDD